MSTSDTLYTDLDMLFTGFPGLKESLEKTCKTRLLQSFVIGHAAYHKTELTPEQEAEKAKYLTVISAFGAESDMGKFAQKALDNMLGNPQERAEKARREFLKPTLETSGRGKRKTLPDNCVVRCPFEQDTYFVVVRGKTGTLYKLDGTSAVLVSMHAHLTGYAKIIESPSAARRLAYAQVNNTTPSMCKDGLGVKKEGYVGGTLAHVVSEEPADWLANPANMPLWVTEQTTEQTTEELTEQTTEELTEQTAEPAAEPAADVVAKSVPKAKRTRTK